MILEISPNADGFAELIGVDFCCNDMLRAVLQYKLIEIRGYSTEIYVELNNYRINFCPFCGAKIEKK